MKKLAWLLAYPLLATPLFAADLMQVYREAQDNDPVFAAARSTLDAGREKAPQGLSGLLPSLTLSGNTVWNDAETEPRNNPAARSSNSYNTNGYQLTLSQPLFRWQNWIAYDQAKLQVAQAEASFVQVPAGENAAPLPRRARSAAPMRRTGSTSSARSSSGSA